MITAPRPAELPVSAMPSAISAMPGRIPSRKTAPPIAAVPTTPSPQRSRTTPAERLMAAIVCFRDPVERQRIGQGWSARAVRSTG
jgi:hypothetical protein